MMADTDKPSEAPQVASTAAEPAAAASAPVELGHASPAAEKESLRPGGGALRPQRYGGMLRVGTHITRMTQTESVTRF